MAQYLSTMDKLEIIDPRPKSHYTRPTAKAILPFKEYRNQATNEIELSCEGFHDDRRPYVVTLTVGNPEQPVAWQCYPIGCNIHKLMRMFYDLEAQIDGVAAERDELMMRVNELEPELERFRKADESRKQNRKREQGE